MKQMNKPLCPLCESEMYLKEQNHFDNIFHCGKCNCETKQTRNLGVYNKGSEQFLPRNKWRRN